uniref:Uncharacterized protein n=1 Tax=Anguilla anguilla TaxID=7936 RepID=A0A0E9UKM4_ANGAN
MHYTRSRMVNNNPVSSSCYT